jgi:hypothetical protein
MRGGGVGFFVKNCLNVEILETFSPFENKIIEALTIQLSYPSSNQPVLLTCIYRSNGPIPNVTASQQMDRFIEKFSNLLADLKTTKNCRLCLLTQILTYLISNRQKTQTF